MAEREVLPKRVGPGGRSFGARERAAVVRALERGSGVRAAARAAGGFDAGTVYYWRRKCPLFRAAFEEAAAKGRRPALVVKGKHGWQVQRSKANRFIPEKKRRFLEHFSAGCNMRAAADAAEIGTSTVSNHLKSDAGFAASFREALEIGYARLEAAALAQRLAAMEKIEFDPGQAEAAAADFTMTMQLLREHKRTLEGAAKPGRPPTRWDFDAAFEALEKRLKAFGIRIEEEGHGDE